MTGKKFDIVVIGAGRIGTALGILLSGRGFRTALVGFDNPFGGARAKLIDESSKEVCPNKNLKFANARKTLDFTVKKGGLIVLATKTTDLTEALERELLQVIGKNKRFLLLSIQNGLGPELQVEKLLRRNNINPNSCLVGAIILGRAAFTQKQKRKVITYKFEVITLGAWNDFQKRKEIIKRAGDLLKPALRVQVCKNREEYRRLRFEKTIMNEANSLASIFAVKTGVLLKNRQLNNWLWKKIDEAMHVARKNGVKLSKRKIRSSVIHTYKELVFNHYPSMTQDLLQVLEHANKLFKTEIDQLDMAIYELGQRSHVPTPTNKFFGEYINELGFSLNYLKENNRRKAAVFGKSLINANRKLVGLRPAFSIKGKTMKTGEVGLTGLKWNLEELQKQFTVPRRRDR